MNAAMNVSQPTDEETMLPLKCLGGALVSRTLGADLRRLDTFSDEALKTMWQVFRPAAGTRRSFSHARQTR